MSFDPNKVAWDPAETASAQSADALYELFEAALADGLDLNDLMSIPAAIPHVMALYAYLADGTKSEYATKLIALGVMLLRDNEWLDALDDDGE
jgi:hypothetical protein